MVEGAAVEDDVAKNLKLLDITPPGGRSSSNADDQESNHKRYCSQNILILDAGYGFPREKKVRKEKINAISSQLSNFLIWQTRKSGLNTTEGQNAIVRVVGCPDENTKELLERRTVENMRRTSSLSSASNWNDDDLPSHVTITCEKLEQCLDDLGINEAVTSTTNIENVDEPVYLSPDANESFDPTVQPPKIAIVGLLIDRRVQPNRSRGRAQSIGIVARRWPLEDCFVGIDCHEPLNVDCVLEGMQQWWWNWKHVTARTSSNIVNLDMKVKRETFIQAVSQAIEHHTIRHPSRPLHIVKHH